MCRSNWLGSCLPSLVYNEHTPVICKKMEPGVKYWTSICSGCTETNAEAFRIDADVVENPIKRRPRPPALT